MATMVKLLHGMLAMGQKVRVNVTPHHFYSDIPDLEHLGKEAYWRRPWSMTGITGTDVDEQLARVTKWCAPYASIPELSRLYMEACERNGEVGYGPIEARVLYGFIRASKPRKIVQIGCGVSTALVLLAAEAEPGYQPEVVCVEPYPTPMLTREHDAGRIRLLTQMAQTVDLEELTSLGAGDLLFVDSTHTVKPGSEVLRIIFDVLPRLREGTFVHFHDITMPYDYSPSTLDTVFFWRETAILMAYLTNNPSFEITVSLSMLHHARQEGLKKILPSYLPRPMRDGLQTGEGHFPSAVYLTRKNTT